MKAALILMALTLVGCGTDDGQVNQVQPKPFTAEAKLAEDNQRAHLNLTSEVEGCEWEVDAAEALITDRTFTAGGHTLLHRYNTKSGSIYSLQDGRVTRWAEVAADGTITIGIQCL